MQRFRGGLVFKAHRLLYHSTLGLRVIKKKKSPPSPCSGRTPCPPVFSCVLYKTSSCASLLKDPNILHNWVICVVIFERLVPLQRKVDLKPGFEKKGTIRQILSTRTLKPRPESGHECLLCAIFARQRYDEPSIRMVVPRVHVLCERFIHLCFHVVCINCFHAHHYSMTQTYYTIGSFV